MLRKLYLCGLQGKDWLLMKEWYTNMESMVKWEGSLSKSFQEFQGVRQGGIWSPTAYKMFINPALDLFEKHQLGFKIGTIPMGSPTCADDELLLSKQNFELKSMLKIQENYSNKERYMLSDQKSKVMTFNLKDHIQFYVLMSGTPSSGGIYTRRRRRRYHKCYQVDETRTKND